MKQVQNTVRIKTFVATLVTALFFLPAGGYGTPAVKKEALALPPVDFSRYEVIINKKPFGEPDVPAVTNPVAVSSQVSFFRNVKMVAVMEADDGGCSVGFIDQGSKPQKNYLLKVGDAEDGIAVVDANYEEGSAKLRKDGLEQWIYMNGDPAGAAPVAAAVAAADSPPKAESYIERLRKRREARAAQVVPFKGLTPAEYAKSRSDGTRPAPISPARALEGNQDESKDKDKQSLSKEELETRLRQYNLDLIRAGGEKGVPLPLELTPEEDAQLVSEGVLPPQEQ